MNTDSVNLMNSSLGQIGRGAVGDNLGKDEFLQLLVTQMRHQDPLQPLGNEDFIAQLAQFASVEQLQSINTGTQTGIMMQQSVSNALSTSLIGKDVLVGGATVQVEGGAERNFHFRLSADAVASITIRSAQGTEIRTIEVTAEDGLPLAEGEHEVVWDGLNNEGQPVADGVYSVEYAAETVNGTAVGISGFLLGRVDGIRFVDGNAWLMMDGMEITLADVLEVRESSGAESQES